MHYHAITPHRMQAWGEWVQKNASDNAKDHSTWYKTVGFAVQNEADGGAKTTCWEFLPTSKRPFGCKQKTFRL